MAQAETPPWYATLFAVPPTPGLMLGIAGLVLVAIGSALPWYSVEGRFSGAGYPEFSTIVGFDGLNGLFVHPQLESNLGLAPPSVGFPVALVFAASAVLKVRKLIRTTTHRMRGSTMVRGSLIVLVPVIATLVVVTQVPLFIPADAPAEARAIGDRVSAQPLGGEATVTLVTPASGAQEGQLRWGFGPAVWVMLAAVAVMNVGSRLDMRTARRALEQLQQQQPEQQQPQQQQEQEADAPPPPGGRAI